MHPVGLEPTTSTSILYLQGKKVPFELDFFGQTISNITSTDSLTPYKFLNKR